MSYIQPILPELTKTYILERITEEQIMEKYIGHSVDNSTLKPNSMCSPLRVDKEPTCNYWYSNTGKLRFKDWSGHFSGDCYDVIASRLGVNSKDRRAFQLILHTIAKDFRLYKYTDFDKVQEYDTVTKEFFNKRKRVKSQTLIKVIPRKWNYRDLKYWNSFLITEEILIIGKVYPVQELYISKNNKPFFRVYSYRFKDPSFAYYGGKDNKGRDKWKVYFPFRKRYEKGNPRFLTSHSFLQGEQLIQPARFCVITKAYKDVLFFRRFNIIAVAPSAESVLITKEEYWRIRPYFDFLVSCMDYDKAGKRMAKQLRDIYGIPPMMFTDGHFNTYNYGSKDPSDYGKANGYNNTLLLFQTIFSKYEEDFNNLDNYFYKKLKFIT